ncbi:MAG: glutamine--tRNA ligase/YqeY domain fusion protein [Defluviitaleaceae bacterium]|nr:glutamine--tRNA ligase/YqeY domain fusion protein [Defluviitaleaceae bacterium]
METTETKETMETKETKHFIQEHIEQDLGTETNKLATRFPPEPNGHLHIGHAKSIHLNFGLALQYGGTCNLRFDDTDPTKESQEYVDSIMDDVQWMGFDFHNKLFFASDYFEQMYQFALILINKGLAFVCDLTPEQVQEYRGSYTEPGKESPYRNRTIEENLKLFAEMREGKYKEGEKTLRAKIDMTSPNISLRDPVIYRITYVPHYRTGSSWCIYPMYDYAHPLEDAIEGITHSLCSIEFVNNRPLYDWFVENVNYSKFERKPRQIEFAKMQMTNTIMGKRYLKKLVDEGKVSGWDDPRLHTIKGLRRRGYTPEIIKEFCHQTGISKTGGIVEIHTLENCARNILKSQAYSIMAVINPLKVTITNYPTDQTEYVTLENNAETDLGSRQVPFGREIYIEAEDFMEDPPKKFFRLTPGGEVRLKGAYFIKCQEVIKDSQGNITGLNCTYDVQTKSGTGFTGRKVKGTIHWVAVETAVKATVQLFDYITTEDSTEDNRFNENSMEQKTAYIEPEIEQSAALQFQFLRHGYFAKDNVLAKTYNCIVNLKSTY